MCYTECIIQYVLYSMYYFNIELTSWVTYVVCVIDRNLVFIHSLPRDYKYQTNRTLSRVYFLSYNILRQKYDFRHCHTINNVWLYDDLTKPSWGPNKWLQIKRLLGGLNLVLLRLHYQRFENDGGVGKLKKLIIISEHEGVW